MCLSVCLSDAGQPIIALPYLLEGSCCWCSEIHGDAARPLLLVRTALFFLTFFFYFFGEPVRSREKRREIRSQGQMHTRVTSSLLQVWPKSLIITVESCFLRELSCFIITCCRKFCCCCCCCSDMHHAWASACQQIPNSLSITDAVRVAWRNFYCHVK